MSHHQSVQAFPTEPGHHLVRLPVTTDLDGHDVGIAMHILVGARPGPTLTLLSGVHGNEWGHIEFLHRFVRDFDPSVVAGSVRVIPTANAPALGALSRAVPDDSDQRPLEWEDNTYRPDDLFRKRHLKSLVDAAVDQLPDHHRTVFMLREMEGKTYEEIAEITGANLGTVKSRLNRARNSFAQLIAPLLD